MLNFSKRVNFATHSDIIGAKIELNMWFKMFITIPPWKNKGLAVEAWLNGKRKLKKGFK